MLPIAVKLTGTTIQQHLHAVVEVQEQQLPAEVASFQGGCQLEREALPCPARTLVVGLDGGYVRHWHKKGCFEVIAGKSIPAEGAAKCFGCLGPWVTHPHGPLVVFDELGNSTGNLKIFFWTTASDYRRRVLGLRSYVMDRTKTVLVASGCSLPPDIIEIRQPGF